VAKITLGNIEMNFFIIPTQPLHCSVFKPYAWQYQLSWVEIMWEDQNQMSISQAD
jgi:hypothetical protein